MASPPLAHARQRGAATLLMSGYSPQAMEQRRADQTQRTLAQARDALIGFALQHGRLPRPAISAQDGRESNTACASDADCSGFLPWVALGVGQADSWGHVLRYSVTPAFTQAPIKRNEALPNNKLGRLTEKLEHLKASVRAKVEHPFHVIKNLLRHRRTRYRGRAKNTAQLFTLCAFANLLLRTA